MTEPTLLIVDDDPGTCETLSDIFQEKGYTVATATTGREARDKAKQTAFNVALIDIKLPDVDGTALLCEFKKTHPDMVCMIITGHASAQNAIKALEEGAEGYFVKPLIIEEIVYRVEETLDKQRLVREKRQAEEALRVSEEKLNAMLQSIGDHMSMMDKDLNILWANEIAKKIFGNDIIGRKCYETYHQRKEPCEPYPCLTLKAFQDGRIHEHDTQVIDKDSKIIYFHCTANVALRDKEGKPTAVMEISKDITERKQAEEERKRLLKELKAKNTELDRFTYTVSHDLRSPLITVQGFIEMLRRDLERNEKEKVESDLKYIERSATKMDHLLTDTLHLSRIGRFVNPPEDVPFGEIVQEAQVQTTEQIKSSGVEITVVEDFPAVHVDRMRIAEVLVNLITNSINYMGEQPRPKIDIGYRVDGEETVFFVQDNGIGIDPSQHEKVFELFYQIERTDNGTGAGLAIAKRIIEVHGGRTWIESEKGKGCTVCFTLPVHTNK